MVQQFAAYRRQALALKHKVRSKGWKREALEQLTEEKGEWLDFTSYKAGLKSKPVTSDRMSFYNHGKSHKGT